MCENYPISIIVFSDHNVPDRILYAITSGMQYLKLFVLWLSVSTIWGIIGTAVGPGIVMLIVALTVGAAGYLLMTLLVFFDYRVHWLYTGMLVSALSLIVSAYLVKGASGIELLILVLYVGLLGVGVSAFATKLSIKRRLTIE